MRWSCLAGRVAAPSPPPCSGVGRGGAGADHRGSGGLPVYLAVVVLGLWAARAGVLRHGVDGVGMDGGSGVVAVLCSYCITATIHKIGSRSGCLRVMELLSEILPKNIWIE